MIKPWLRQAFPPTLPGIIRAFYLLVALYAWSRLVRYVVGSFDWPMDGDLSFLYYIAWLMNEHHYVPYRDVHETSFFGTFIFYSGLTRLIGYSTAAFHWADLFFFSVLSLITFFLLKPFGKLCALLAIALFGEFYFKMGFGVHLQRDFAALLPAAAALLLLRQQNLSATNKSFLAGILFGVASCIKPQFAGGIALCVWYLTFAEKKPDQGVAGHFSRVAASSLAGFLCAWVVGFLWLYAHGVTNEFLDMAIHYLPAYSSINGRNFARASADAWVGAGKWLWGMVVVWALPIAASLYGIFRNEGSENKSTRYWLFMLVGFWFLYLVYVPMAGKYWGYHILPAYYFLALVLSLVAARKLTASNKVITFMAVLVWSLTYFFNIVEDKVSTRHQALIKSHEQSEITARALESFLKNTLKEGDRTQAHVSHTRGPVFPALLASRALPATPYLENYLLYHDVDSPFVQKARERFLSTLQQNPPRFIIYTSTLFGFRGPGTETMFVPFEQWMKAHYKRVFASHQEFAPAFDRVEIYEYRPDGPGNPAPSDY